MSFSPAPYPALRLLIAACIGVTAGAGLSLPVMVWILCAGFSALLLPVIAYGLERRFFRQGFAGPVTIACFFLLALSAFAAWSAFRYSYVGNDSVLRYLDRDILLHGTVSGRPRVLTSGQRMIVDADTIFIDGTTVSASGRVTVFVRSSMPEEGLLAEPGDSVWLKGKPERLAERANPGDFNPAEYYRRLGIHASMFVAGPWLVHNEGLDQGAVFEGWLVRPVRHFLEGALESLLPHGHERNFFRGLVLGERELLDPAVYDGFRRTGTAHVLAISGLHVGLLVLVVLLFMQRFRGTTTGKWLVVAVVALLLLIYSQVTGNAPSVRRASIMTVVLLAGYAAGRQTYPLNSLAVADLLMLAADPLELYQAGFLMTNAAVASILLLYPLLSLPAASWKGGIGRFGRALWNPFCISLSAMAGVSPLIALYFGSFSIAGIAANLPVVFLVSAMIFSMLPALLLHLFQLPFAEHYAAAAWFFAHAALSVTGFFSRWENASVAVRPDAVMVALYYVIALVLLYFLYRKKTAGLIIALCAAANVICWYPLLNAGPSARHLIPVRTGKSAALLYSTASSAVLIDAGSRHEHMAFIERQMARNRIASLDAAIRLMSPDSLVSQVEAASFMLSDERRLVTPSLLVTRVGKDMVAMWDSAGESVLVASGIDVLTRCVADHAGRRVVVLMQRFGIDEYRRFAGWFDRAQPEACMVLCSGSMPKKDRTLIAHLARGRLALSVY